MEKKNVVPKKWIGFLLSLFFTGLGQIYKGQFLKGLSFWIIISFLLPMIYYYFNLWYTFIGMCFILVSKFIFHVYTILDTLYYRVKYVTYPKSYNKWYVYVILILSSLIIDSYFSDYYKFNVIGIKANSIPTVAMYPTIQVGDYIMSDIEKLKDTFPNRGDIVSYKANIQGNEIEAVSRIVALPGDTIIIRRNRVIINGRTSHYKDTTNHDGDSLLVETFENCKPHIISVNVNPAAKDDPIEFGPYILFKNEIFVMGDNRNFAYDSRYIGPVSVNRLIGRPLYIYLSSTIGRIGTTF